MNFLPTREKWTEQRKMEEVRRMPGKRTKTFPKQAGLGSYWFSSQALIASLYSTISSNPDTITMEYRQLV